MKKTLAVSILTAVACTVPAYAETLDSSIEIRGSVTKTDNNKSKLSEYTDTTSGLTANIVVDKSVNSGNFLIKLDNIGLNADSASTRRDQSLRVEGSTEETKLKLYYDETPHNLTLGAKTLYEGVGTTALITSQANTATSAAALSSYTKNFDYKLDRKNTSIEIELGRKGPFFLVMNAERGTIEGLLPLGAYVGQQKELPAPIDYITSNLGVVGGYRTNKLLVTIDGAINRFDDTNYTFTHSYAGTPTTVYLAPDNTNKKIGASFKYNLPFIKSTLMGRVSYSDTTNSTALTEGYNNIGGVFNGKITYKTASTSLSSKPSEMMETRLYLNVLDKKNDSPAGFTYGATSSESLTTSKTEKFDYNKINGGLDLSYKLNKGLIASTGYEYLRMNRLMNFEIIGTTYMGARTDAPQTTDHALFAQIKAHLSDKLEGKVRYQYLSRSSDFRGDLFSAAGDSSIVKTVWRPVDTADKHQHSVKAGLEYEVGHNLIVGAEYGLKYNDYIKSLYGMQNDVRHDFYVDADYRIGSVNVTPYVELEYTANNSKHRTYTTAANFLADASNASFDWSSRRKDLSYALGANAVYNVVDKKIQLITAYRYDNASGTEDFSYSSINALATPLTSNNYVDNYTKHTLNAKVNYTYSRKVDVGLGYRFESLRYTDDHYTDYAYMISKTAGVMFTGAYANPNYNSHLAYVTATYKF